MPGKVQGYRADRYPLFLFSRKVHVSLIPNMVASSRFKWQAHPPQQKAFFAIRQRQLEAPFPRLLLAPNVSHIYWDCHRQSDRKSNLVRACDRRCCWQTPGRWRTQSQEIAQPSPLDRSLRSAAGGWLSSKQPKRPNWAMPIGEIVASKR